ncbi:MAG: glycosyltransferase family 2 protein [Hyphomicrobiaceae bacterium]|nr:MAG: glycosyltransferase family 2 protein [Hyphomicrobiaceae bacterium]
MEKLIAVTPTGARLEAFALCQTMMERQTQLPDSWIVVDDGAEIIDAWRFLHNGGKFRGIYHRPDQRWEPGKNTHVSNLRQAIAILKTQPCEWIAFIEDDDWYHPEYFERALEFLDANPDVLCLGEANAKYYNLRTHQFRLMGGTDHASLCQTIVHHTYLPLLEAFLEQGSSFFDIPFWCEAKKLGHAFLFPESTHCVGIKGLPGRGGIGCGHKPAKDWDIDSDNLVLRSWIGDDVELYKPFLEMV